MKKKLTPTQKKKLKEFREQLNICSDSVNFWINQVTPLIEKLKKIDEAKQPIKAQKLSQQLDYLEKKAEIESEISNDLQKRLKAWLKKNKLG